MGTSGMTELTNSRAEARRRGAPQHRHAVDSDGGVGVHGLRRQQLHGQQDREAGDQVLRAPSGTVCE